MISLDFFTSPSAPLPTPLPAPLVTPFNVLLALALLLLDIILSALLHLEISKTLLISAGRCIIQLSLMGFVLDAVFKSDSPWAVAAMSLGMLALGGNEVTYARSSRRPKGLLLTSFISLACSVVPIATLGAKFAIVRTPFWAPESFIPILGMITGNAISSMALANAYVVRELSDNCDKIEVYISFGATRLQAARPIMKEALKLALMPTINQMSVIGLISIPGMMTGAILAGQPIDQAAKMQMIIMFLITSTTTLCVSICLILELLYLIDKDCRIRADRIVGGGYGRGWEKMKDYISSCWAGRGGRLRLE